MSVSLASTADQCAYCGGQGTFVVRFVYDLSKPRSLFCVACEGTGLQPSACHKQTSAVISKYDYRYLTYMDI